MGDGEREKLLEQLAERTCAMRLRSLRSGPIDLPADLTLQQLRVLGLIAQAPGLTNHDLRQALGVSAPTCTGLVDRLVDKGLVRRGEDDTDRRVRRVHLTDAGARILDGLESQLQRQLDTLTGYFTTGELRTLVAGYDVVLAALDRVRDEPRAGVDNPEQ